MTESLLEIEGQKFFVRDSTNDSDVVRSCRTEYMLPNMDGYEPGSFVLDIGSHIGGFSLWALQKYHQCRVIAVEPIPENQVQFMKNVELNGLQDRVTLLRGAVWKKSEPTVVIPYGDESTESGRIHRWIGNVTGMPQSHTQHVVARSMSLKDVMEGVPKVWCLKSDGENNEYPMFEESDPELLRSIKWIIGEHHRGIEPIRNVLRIIFNEHPSPQGYFCFENPLPFRVL
jgi:FkbM family methyltransferase